MQLIINHHTGGRLRTSSGGLVVLDKFYDLPDHPGARFIVRSQTTSSVTVEIKRGKMRVQIGTIQLLSATCGDRLTGGSEAHPYVVDLDPDKSIWPIGGIVDDLRRDGDRELEDQSDVLARDNSHDVRLEPIQSPDDHRRQVRR